MNDPLNALFIGILIGLVVGIGLALLSKLVD